MLTAESSNPAFAILESGEPMFAETEGEYRAYYPEIANLDVEGERARAFWCVPLTAEGKSFGIKVFAVAPGAVETQMLRKPFPDFPAEKALQPDDVAGVTLELEPGTKLAMEVLRNGRRHTVDVTLGTRPPLRRSSRG